MAKSPPSGDRGPLERLCGDEAELERSLAEARRDAAATVAAARGEAERIVADARRALEEELAVVRSRSEGEALVEAARTREALEADVVALARRAERNRARTLERLVEIVLGRMP